MAPINLDQLVQRIAGRFGLAAFGSASSGSTSTLVDTAGLYQPDNTWNNYYLRMPNAPHSGAERLITAFSQASKQATFDPVLPNAVAVGHAYQILPLQYQNFADAVQGAIYAAGDKYLVLKDDKTSLNLTQAQEYSLPADLAVLYSVWLGYQNQWTEVNSYTVLGVPGAYKMLMGPLNDWKFTSVFSGLEIDMRIQYAAMPTMIAQGVESLGIGEISERSAVAFIEEYALHILHQSQVARNVTGEKARAHLALHEQHFQQAEAIRSRWQTKPVSRSIKTRTVPDILG